DALAGARDIAAEWINEDQGVRSRLRRLFTRYAVISAKVVKKREQEEASQKFQQYFEWEERLKNIPSHRLLAMQRAENEGVIKLKVGVDKEEALLLISGTFLKDRKNSCTPHLEQAIEDAYKRLLHPALSNESLSAA